MFVCDFFLCTQIYPSVVSTKPLLGVDALTFESFSDELGRWQFPSLPFGMSGSTFDRGFEGIHVDTTDVVKDRKKSGLMGFMTSKKPLSNTDYLLIGMNTRRPRHEGGKSASTIKVYKFLSPEKEDGAEGSSDWFSALGKGPMILAILAGAFMLKGKMGKVSVQFYQYSLN